MTPKIEYWPFYLTHERPTCWPLAAKLLSSQRGLKIFLPQKSKLAQFSAFSPQNKKQEAESFNS